MGGKEGVSVERTRGCTVATVRFTYSVTRRQCAYHLNPKDRREVAGNNDCSLLRFWCNLREHHPVVPGGCSQLYVRPYAFGSPFAPESPVLIR